MSVEMNQVLAQMRAMAAAAQDSPTTDATGQVGRSDFAEIIKASLDKVNEVQSDARSMADAFEAGEKGVELPEVMVALQKANISFQAITQVRNKLLNAYQEVMNMQV
jgi:flagellar hook-basal body complex protein FliE